MNDNYMPVWASAAITAGSPRKRRTSVRDYLSLKIKQAQWVIGGIEQRRTTLLGCAQEIVQRQEMFFRRGRGHLVPMTQSELADILGVHESTVSRTIRGKYLQCCFRDLSVDFFFSRALGDGCGGEVSAESAKECIRALVPVESPKKPLSDQKLTELLARKGSRSPAERWPNTARNSASPTPQGAGRRARKPVETTCFIGKESLGLLADRARLPGSDSRKPCHLNHIGRLQTRRAAQKRPRNGTGRGDFRTRFGRTFLPQTRMLRAFPRYRTYRSSQTRYTFCRARVPAARSPAGVPYRRPENRTVRPRQKLH